MSIAQAKENRPNAVLVQRKPIDNSSGKVVTRSRGSAWRQSEKMNTQCQKICGCGLVVGIRNLVFGFVNDKDVALDA